MVDHSIALDQPLEIPLHTVDRPGQAHHRAGDPILTHEGRRVSRSWERIDEGRLHLITIASPRVDRTSRYRILFNTGEVRRAIELIRPDVIEAGDPYHLAWGLLKQGREMRIPVCGFYHSHFPDAYLRTVHKYAGTMLRDVLMTYAEDYIERLYNQFAHTLVPSSHLCEVLHSWGVLNTVQVKLGVDTTIFKPGTRDESLRTELGIPKDSRILLYVGRLATEKNIKTLLEAYSLLHQKRKDLWLIIIGDGPLRRLLPAVRSFMLGS